MKTKLIFLLILLFVVQYVGAQIPRVAVIPFSSVGVVGQDAQSVSLLFETSLQQTKAFTLIEMVETEKILDAQKYSLRGVVDESQAVEIGRLLSVDQIVVGTVGKVDALYYLAVKIINVETGEHLAAEKAQAQSLSSLIGKLDDVALLLAEKDQSISFDSDEQERSPPSIIQSDAAAEPNGLLGSIILHPKTPYTDPKYEFNNNFYQVKWGGICGSN